jgi:hypothetical protein
VIKFQENISFIYNCEDTLIVMLTQRKNEMLKIIGKQKHKINFHLQICMLQIRKMIIKIDNVCTFLCGKRELLTLVQGEN